MNSPWLISMWRAAFAWLRRTFAQVKHKPWLIVVIVLALLPGLVALLGGVFVLALFLLKVLWAWTIPDLFPGAVEQGLVARTISWFTALKVLIVVIFLGALAGVGGARKSER